MVFDLAPKIDLPLELARSGRGRVIAISRGREAYRSAAA